MTIAEFWNLAVESRLLTPQLCQQLGQAYAQAAQSSKSAPRAESAEELARWLITRAAITRYQARVLLAGRAGPFVYGDYLVQDKLESGRLAGTFRARHIATSQRVLLYFLAGPALAEATIATWLAEQVDAVGACGKDEPHLARVYQLVDLGSFKFIVLEDLHGESAASMLASEGRFAPGKACRMARGAALGLARLHDRGLIHAHVDPRNLWIERGGQPKLLHFPLAFDPLSPGGTNETSDQNGRSERANYLAPELAGNGAPTDRRSDIYSLGCTLYELLAGQPPFTKTGPRRSTGDQGERSPPALDSLNREVPVALVRIVGYMMNHNPDLRYQQARSVAEALAPLSDPEPAPSARESSRARQAYEEWLRRDAVRATHATTTAAGHWPASPTPQTTSIPVAVAAPMAVAQAPPATHPSPTWPVPIQVAAQAVAHAGGSAAADGPGTMFDVHGIPPPLVSDFGPTSARFTRAQRRSTRPAWRWTGLACAVVAFGTVIWFVAQALDSGAGSVADVENAGTERGPSTGQQSNAARPDKTQATSREQAANDTSRVDPVRGLEEPIWESPTSGPPLDLAYLAPGAQLIVALRPADLVRHDEWEKIADPRVSGPMGGWLAADLAESIGIKVDHIESVLIGLLDATPDAPRMALVVRTLEAVPKQDLLSAWGKPKSEKIGQQTIYRAGDRAWMVPASEKGKLIVMAPAQDISAVAEASGQAPPLRRELEVLLAASDRDRHVTMLVAPNFPFTGGKTLWAGAVERLKQPVENLFTLADAEERLQLPKAISISVHLDDRLFIEVRMHNSFAGRHDPTMARELRQRWADLPEKVNDYVRDLNLSAYSKGVLWDFPRRVEALDRFTRVGVDDQQIVLRAYLPSAGAHHLLLGTHLALLEQPGTQAVATTQEPPSEKSVAQRLQAVTSLSFPKNTLERSIELLAEDVGVDMIILGGDLQTDGITKNQSFELDERDQPAEAILLKILQKANPAGKLVYVIKPKENGGADTVYITTRAAVEKRGDKLPPSLEQK